MQGVWWRSQAAVAHAATAAGSSCALRLGPCQSRLQQRRLQQEQLPLLPAGVLSFPTLLQQQQQQQLRRLQYQHQYQQQRHQRQGCEEQQQGCEEQQQGCEEQQQGCEEQQQQRKEEKEDQQQYLEQDGPQHQQVERSRGGFTVSWAEGNFSSNSSKTLHCPAICSALLPFCNKRLFTAGAVTGVACGSKAAHFAAAAVSSTDAAFPAAALAQGLSADENFLCSASSLGAVVIPRSSARRTAAAASSPASSTNGCTSAAGSRKRSVLRTRMLPMSSWRSTCCGDNSWSNIASKPCSSTVHCSSCCCHGSTVCCHVNSPLCSSKRLMLNISAFSSHSTTTSSCFCSIPTYVRRSSAIRGNSTRHTNSSRCSNSTGRRSRCSRCSRCSSSSCGILTRNHVMGLCLRYKSGHGCSSRKQRLYGSTQGRSSSTQDYSRWLSMVRCRSIRTISCSNGSRRHSYGFSGDAVNGCTQYSSNTEFQSLTPAGACSSRCARSSRRSACYSKTESISYSSCNDVASSTAAVACRNSSSIPIKNMVSTRNSVWCYSSDDSGNSRRHSFGRFNRMKYRRRSSSNMNNMRSCWSIDRSGSSSSSSSGLTSIISSPSHPDFTCSSLSVLRSYGCSMRSRSDLFKEPVAAAGEWGASTCVSRSQIQANIFEASTYPAAEKVGCWLRASVPSTVFCRTLVHALPVKQQQEVQQEQQEQQNVNFSQFGRGLTYCEDIAIATVPADALSHSYPAPAGEQQQQQQVASPNEDGAAAIPPATAMSVQVQPRAAALQAQATARATYQRGLRGNEEQQPHHEELAYYAQTELLLRESYVPGGDETSLTHERLGRETLLSMQEAGHEQQTKSEQQNRGKQQEREKLQERGEQQERGGQQQHRLSRLPWIGSRKQQRSSLVGEELLRSIQQLPWARRLSASLDSVAAAAKATTPDAVTAIGTVEAAAGAAEETAAGEVASAARNRSAGVLDRGAAAARKTTSTAANIASCSRPVSDATTPAGASAAPKLEAAKRGDSAAAAEATDSAAETSDPAAAEIRGHTRSTAGATASEVSAAVDTAAAWWKRQAPCYLGPVIRRISRCPGDVHLRLIQLALAHTPLQKEICLPQRHQLQQQAESMIQQHCIGDAAVEKKWQQQQQDARLTQMLQNNHINCSRSNRRMSASSLPREAPLEEEEAAEASCREGSISARETVTHTTAAFETQFVSAGIDSLSEADVIVFGAPFLWFTQNRRLPLLQRLWCVEQLAFWLHGSGRATELRRLRQAQRHIGVTHQDPQPGQTAKQQQQRQQNQRVQYNTRIDAEDSLRTTAGEAGEDDTSPLNEGCFQVSPQGDLQVSDIRVWRSIGVAIRYLLHEGFLDRAAHMLYSMLSLLYDARAFPAPAPKTFPVNNSSLHAETCSASLASSRDVDDVAPECTARSTAAASRPAAYKNSDTPAAVTTEVSGIRDAKERLSATESSAVGLLHAPKAAAAAFEAKPSARVGDLSAASAEDDARLSQRKQDNRSTEKNMGCCSVSSVGPSGLLNESVSTPENACSTTVNKKSRSPLLSAKNKEEFSDRSNTYQHAAANESGSSLISHAPAGSKNERLLRHLELTRWSMSKPVWLKVLARRRCLALTEQKNEATADLQNAHMALAPPLQQHELEAVALLESLFFKFHDEVRCAAQVMTEALDKHQAAEGSTAGIRAAEPRHNGAADGNAAWLLRSSSSSDSPSTATSKRLMERFASAAYTDAGGESHVQQCLRRLHVVKRKEIHYYSGAAKEDEQRQRLRGGQRWMATVLGPNNETCLRSTVETSVSQKQTESGIASSFSSYMTPHTSAGSGSSTNAIAAGTVRRPRGVSGEQDDAISAATQAEAAETSMFSVRTLVWYLRLQSHFYKVQSVAMTTMVCRLLTRLLRLRELQRLYPPESRRRTDSSGGGACLLDGSTSATAPAVTNPLSLFSKRETLPLPFTSTATAGRPQQDGVIVSRVAPSVRGATMATTAVVLLAQIFDAVKAVHFYDHELLHACCEALRPNVCLLPPQYACGVIFNLGCLGYSDPALASSVAHFLVDSGLLKKETNVDAMMQLLIGFSRLDFRDDRLTSACIDAIMAMPDVLSQTCRPVSVFYLLHSISFHNVRSLPLLVRLLPALQRYAAIVPINVAVLTFHDIVKNSMWPGPYRRLIVPRLLKGLPSLSIAALAGATPLCWSLWGHFDVPLLLQLVQQFNKTRAGGSSTGSSTAGLLSRSQLSQQTTQMEEARVSGHGVRADGDSDQDAQSTRIVSHCGEEQGVNNEGSPRVGNGSTTLTLVKASTQLWSAFYCVQLLGLTPRDFLAHAQDLDRKYMRRVSKDAKRQRHAKDTSLDRHASATLQQHAGPERDTSSNSSFALSHSEVNEQSEVAGKERYKRTSPVSVYIVGPHFNSRPSVRFSPWQAGSLVGLKAAQILQTPEANWTPRSSTLHEEVLAACPHQVRAAAINEQPAGPYEVDLVIPAGVLASTRTDLAQRRKRP